MEMLRSGVDPEATIPSILYERYHSDYKKNYVREQGYGRNLDSVKRIENSIIGSIPIAELRPHEIDLFLRSMTKYSNSSITKIYRQLRLAFEIAVEKGIIENNLMLSRDLRCPKSSKEDVKIRGLTVEEQKRLVEVMEAKKPPYGRNDYRLQLFIELYSGMRMCSFLFDDLKRFMAKELDDDITVMMIRYLDKDSQTVPESWDDIKNGTYKVAIGDINGGNAQAAVIASNFALGGDLTNLDPAFDFWAQMAKDGRINTLDITQQNFETGEAEVGVVWSFTGVPYSKDITNYEMKATVPTDGSIQSGYASVINKYAPHPNAAALAREVMFSDEGQTYLANAGGIPTRTDVTIDGFDPDQYKNCILMDDTDAYSKACEEVVSRWQEEITPLLVQ